MQSTELTILDAIHHRRSIRDFTSARVSEADIRTLLDAAVHAPTALHEEPWAFAIVQDAALLARISERAKSMLLANSEGAAASLVNRFTAPGFNIFYNAGTLVVIAAKTVGQFVVADCWLAAENLMLAAGALGLGTCCIGLALPALNTPEIKKDIGLAPELTAVAAIIVGRPAAEVPPVPRKPPHIVAWK